MTIGEQPGKEASRAVEIKVLSLNAWGIPFVSNDRIFRIQALADHLISGPDAYNYVFLQEVWSKSDFQLLANKVSKVLPHSHYFHSGIIGSGICILSCTPIREVFFHEFNLNGYPHKILHADWYGGKGVAMCRTTFQGIPLLLCNTHLHAEYDCARDEYIHHRVVQAFEASQLMRFTNQSHHLVIFAGDFNCICSDVSYRLLVHNSGLIDAFNDCPNKPPDGIGATNQAPGNSYTNPKCLRLDPNGQRIDHIFYWCSPEYEVLTTTCDQPFPLRVPQQAFSFSDHEAVRAVFSIKPSQFREIEDPQEDVGFARTDSLLDASAVCTQGLRTVNKTKKAYFFLSIVIGLLQVTLSFLYFTDTTPFGQFLLSICLMLLTMGFGFCFIHAGLFLNKETSVLTATQAGLEKLLEEVRQKNARFYERQRKQALNATQ